MPTELERVAEEYGLRVVDVAVVTPTTAALALVSADQAQRFQLLPISLADEGPGTSPTLTLAQADPLATEGLDIVAQRCGHLIETVLAEPTALASAIARAYGSTAEPPFLADSSPERDQTPAAGTITATDADSDAPIIRLVHQIIEEGVARRASDIHLEPLAKRFRVRYRIDGRLVEAANPPKRLERAVLSRVKLMADISIAEKRVPQDGRIAIAVGGKPLDLRVSSLPSAHGESIVMRILDQSGLRLGLGELGFADADRDRFTRLIQQPDGMILVTGPTGSGKTTTLYSCLHHLNKPDRKLITVEDPVEYQLSGVNQVPVRHDVGMTFTSALRAMLRQAPNIIMVGEIRDRETAEIAINASLTGHMVFSTLHTNDAAGAITRLLDIGVKPFLIASSLRAVVAQRLVRRCCRTCEGTGNAESQSAPFLPSTLGPRPSPLNSPPSNLRTPVCPTCNGTGFYGRIGIYEILEIDEAMQKLVYEGASLGRLRQHARQMGMRTMRDDGLTKAASGLTTEAEVLAVTV